MAGGVTEGGAKDTAEDRPMLQRPGNQLLRCVLGPVGAAGLYLAKNPPPRTFILRSHLWRPRRPPIPGEGSSTATNQTCPKRGLPKLPVHQGALATHEGVSLPPPQTHITPKGSTLLEGRVVREKGHVVMTRILAPNPGPSLSPSASHLPQI